MARLRPGDQMGHYRVDSRIGAGGMGVVYLAYDTALERPVALKVLAAELAADEGFRRRFSQEARAAAAVDHPHVLTVYEAGEHDGQLFLVTRYVPGIDLGTLLAREGALPLDRTVDLIGEVAGALDAAHAAGLVHRDVKPGNILIGPSDHTYLADFGLARAASAASDLTKPGQVGGGSPDYIAPELLEGRQADARSDAYALACVAFACLAGRPPFRRSDDIATLYAQVHDPPPVLTDVRKALPRSLDAVFNRGLAKAPEARFATAGEFAASLRAAAAKGAGIGKAAASPLQRRVRVVSASGSRAVIGATAVAVVAVALIAALGTRWFGAMGPTAPVAADARDGRIAFAMADARDGSSRLGVVDTSGGGDVTVFLPGERNPRGSPSWTPDGTWLAVEADGDIWRVRADGTDAELVTQAAYSPAWAPDGKRLAFTRVEEAGGAGFVRPEIVVIREADGSERELVQGWVPSWSPDGSRVAFVAESSLWIVDADGQDRRQLTTGDLEVEFTSRPGWSPDGSSIAFAANTPGGEVDLYITNPSGSTLRRLTHERGHELYPSWSPDGSRLAFKQGMSPETESLGILWLDGGEVETLPVGAGTTCLAWGPAGSGGLLTSDMLGRGPPTFGPSPLATVEPTPATDLLDLSRTTRIGFVGVTNPEMPDEEIAAYGIQPDRTGLARLLFDVGPCCGSFAFSPDGKAVALARLRLAEGPPTYDLRVIQLEGLPEEMNFGVVSSSAAWSPDGGSVAFVREGSIVVLDLNSGATRSVARLDEGSSSTPPTWAPDGRRIAYALSYTDGTSIIWSVIEGEGPRRLALLPEVRPLDLVWSPDGERFALSSEGDDGGAIYVVTPAGLMLMRLTSSGTDANVTWAPDGSWLAFQSQRDGTAEIYVMRPDGSEQTRVTDALDGVDARGPTWGVLDGVSP